MRIIPWLVRVKIASLAPLILVSAILLSGCVGSGAEPQEGSQSPAPSVAPPGGFDENTGAVRGLVTDPELVPLVDVEVALIEAELQTRTALDGSFSFGMVPPGEYTLAAAKLGYEANSKRVSVRAGEETSGISIVLAPLPVVEAHIVQYQFKGFIACSVGYAGILSEECGEGLQTDFGTYGKNPNNKIDWKFNISTIENLETIFLELDWKPASAAAQQLAFNVAHGFKCTPGCGAVKTFCGAFQNYGRPVQKCAIEGSGLGIKDPEKQLPFDITARAWAAPVEETEFPNIVVEQPFEMYRTEFFGEPMPEGYSQIRDK